MCFSISVTAQLLMLKDDPTTSRAGEYIYRVYTKTPNKQANREEKGVQHTSHQQQAVIQSGIQVVWEQAEPDPISWDAALGNCSSLQLILHRIISLPQSGELETQQVNSSS